MNVRKRQRYLRVLRKYEHEDTECEDCEEEKCPNCIAREAMHEVDDTIKHAMKKIKRIDRERHSAKD